MSVASFVNSQVSSDLVSSLASTVEGEEKVAVVLSKKLKNALFQIFHHVGKSDNHKTLLFLLIVELLQFLTLAWSPVLDYYGFSTSFFEWIILIRTLGAGRVNYSGHVTIFTFLLLYLVILGSLLVNIYLRLQQMEEDHIRRKYVVNRMLQFFPILYLPAMTYAQYFLSCTGSHLTFFPDRVCWDTENAVLSAISIVFTVALIFIGAASSLFFWQWQPSLSSWTSVVNPRLSFILFVGKTILVILGSYMYHSSDIVYGIYGGIMIAFNMSLLAYLLYFLPYHNLITNMVTAGLLSASTLAAIIAFICAIARSSSLVGMIVFLVGMVPFALGAAAGVYLRTRKIVAHVRVSAESTVTFVRPFEVEITARYYYTRVDAQSKEDGLQLFYAGTDQFRSNSDITIAAAVYMIARNCDLSILHVNLIKAQQYGSSLDLQFLLHSLEQARIDAVEKIDGGAEQISHKLKHLMRYQEASKKWIRAFWEHLIKEEDLSELPHIVVLIEKNEKKAEFILKMLLHRYPNSPRVVRAYAVFLEEVKNDIELSQMMFHTAEEIEEELSKKKNRKNKTAFASKDKIKKNAFSTEGYEDDRITPVAEPVKRSSLMENSKVTRIEIIRQRNYRKKIGDMRSTALKQLGLSIKLTMVAALTFMIVVYAVSKTALDAYKTDVEELVAVGTVAALVENYSHLSADGTGSDHINYEEFVTINIPQLKSILADISKLLYEVLVPNIDRKEVRDFWYDVNTFEKNYFPITDSYTVTNASVWDLVNKFHQYASQSIAVMDGKHFDLDWATYPPYRYVLDNRGELSRQLELGMKIYEDGVHIDSSIITLQIIIIPTIGFVLALILSLILLLPALRAISKERKKIVELFLAIPKPTLLAVGEALRGGGDVDEPNDFEEERSREEATLAHDVASTEITSGSNVSSVLKFRYFISTGLVFLLFFGVVVTVYLYVHFTNPMIPNIVVASNLYGTLIRIHFFTVELGRRDTVTYGTLNTIRKDIREAIDDVQLYREALVYGSDEWGTVGNLYSSSEQKEIYFNRPCLLPESYQSPDSCRGLIDLLNMFLQQTRLALTVADDDLNEENQVIADALFFADSLQMFEYAFESVTAMEDGAVYMIDTAVIILAVVFAVSIIVVIISYTILRPTEIRFKEENSRTTRMLLMLPMSVIDSVPAIKEYLESGKSDNADKKMREAYEESVARSKSIVDASQDAICGVNQDYIIETFNPSSEELFGYQSMEIVGKNVKTLFSEKQNLQFMDDFFTQTHDNKTRPKAVEVLARRHNGTEFPVHLSISEARVNGKRIFAIFMRDITEMKAYQRALEHEKETTDKFLFRILPKSIAEILKKEGLDNNNRQLIAEAYKEVTVVFCDLVGFTTISSGVSPTDLVWTLNTLVSSWDQLCEKHGLEKIKTIGDCYMAASGVPQRRMDHAQAALEFCIDVLDSLEEFNTETNSHLQLRIGLNTGPVVAGVIGHTKFAYDLWGDAVNVASRMESNGVPGRIQVSQESYDLLKNEYVFEERGKISIKGKGYMITYLYKDRQFERTKSGRLLRKAAIGPPVQKTLGLAALSPAVPKVQEHVEKEPEILLPHAVSDLDNNINANVDLHAKPIVEKSPRSLEGKSPRPLEGKSVSELKSPKRGNLSPSFSSETDKILDSRKLKKKNS